MAIIVRSWGAPAQAYDVNGTSTSVSVSPPSGTTADDISVLTIQTSPADAVLHPPAGWIAVGGGEVNTHLNSEGPDSFAVMFVRRGDISDTATDIFVERSEGPGWVKARVVSYQKDTEPGWTYSVLVDDYTYGVNDVSGTGIFLTLDSDASAPVPEQSVFTDDFETLNLDDWTPYDGPGRGGFGLRMPINVSAVDGVLTLVGSPNGHTGGVKIKNHSQQYGEWKFRARIKPGAGYYRPLIRLWAVGGGDGDENPNGVINIIEPVRNPTRDVNTFTIHYTNDVRSTSAFDMTLWHVYRLRWEQGVVSLYVDGTLVGVTYNTAAQPVGAADFCILLEYYAAEVTPTSAKRQAPSNYLAASLEVDYVKQYVVPT
mgnify:CR=1 FL=1